MYCEADGALGLQDSALLFFGARTLSLLAPIPRLNDTPRGELLHQLFCGERPEMTDEDWGNARRISSHLARG